MLVDGLATDADFLYYMTFEAIWRVPLEGGSHDTVVGFGSPTGDGYTALYAGSDDLVFETVTPLEGELKTLHRVSKEDGSRAILATSTYEHAFRGVALDRDTAYYGTDEGLFRVPLAGGAAELVSAGSGTSAHPIVTPTLVGNDVFWAEGEKLFKIAKTASGAPGIEVAAFDATAEIIGNDEQGLVVALAPEQPEDAVRFVEVDPATGDAVRAPSELGRELWASLATSDAVWAGSRDGLFRIPRAGGAAERLTTESVAPLAASDDAVFAGTVEGVFRFAR